MALFLYRLFLILYRLGAWLISPWNDKARAWRRGRVGIFDRLEQAIGGPRVGGRPLVWFHCASLGEFEQARPLMEKIRETRPGHRILLTFFSPSGYEVKKDYAGADAVFYLPSDSPAHARQLLAIAQPELVCWVKYEYWYFYLTEIHKNHIPLLLVSGIFRPGQPFFRWWGGFHRHMLSCFTHFFVQNEASKKLLGTLGYSRQVTVSGDTRFDRVTDIAGRFTPLPLVEQFLGNSPSVVAGSTWEEDEEELDHFANTHPEIKFIIAPHEIDEDHLKEIEKLFHRTVRYSVLSRESGAGSQEALASIPESAGSRPPTPDSGLPTPDSRLRTPDSPLPTVLIIDNIGLLSRLYRYATIAYIGGGFGEDGIHNALEAAVYGKPVVFGPVYDKYAEAVDLVDAGGAFSIENALELEKTLSDLLNNKTASDQAGRASKEYVYTHTGATEKILRYLEDNRLLPG